MPAIASLKGKSKLYDLIALFVQGTLTQVLAAIQSSKQIFTDAHVQEQDVVTKAKLLTLAHVLAEQVGNEVALDIVAEKIQVDKLDVEKWILKAIGLKLIAVRIDQVRRSVFVKYVFYCGW